MTECNCDVEHWPDTEFRILTNDEAFREIRDEDGKIKLLLATDGNPSYSCPTSWEDAHEQANVKICRSKDGGDQISCKYSETLLPKHVFDDSTVDQMAGNDNVIWTEKAGVQEVLYCKTKWAWEYEEVHKHTCYQGGFSMSNCHKNK